MSQTATQRSRAEAEAADWFARQCRVSITTDELYAFREWKRDPANAAAYAAVEQTWTAAGGLSADPDIQAATNEALEARPSRRAAPPPSVRARWLYGIVAAAAVAGIAASIIFRGPLSYETRVGEQKLVTLEDGSRVRLNTDSKLIVRFRPDERRVELVRGEGFFEAAHDAARPFVVAAEGTHIQALGTKFDVRRDADLVKVTLLEGRVRVARQDSPGVATLSPNQQLTVSEKGISPVRAANAVEASSWTTGQLTFHAVPLEAAVAEVNRYAVRKISLDGPPSLAASPITGVFNTGDTKAFVAAVEGLLDLQSSKDAAGTTHLAPRAETPPG